MSEKKNKQLGINFSTAQNRLKKIILFKYIKLANENICSICNLPIEDENDLTIEHNIPWIDSEEPKKLFWDLDNISFAHSKCNSSIARRKTSLKHPSISSYKKGCRCDECKEIQKIRMRKYRSN